MHIAGMRERNTAGGGALDAISAFRRALVACQSNGAVNRSHSSLICWGRFNWKLDGTTDPILRKLCHKDLRLSAGSHSQLWFVCQCLCAMMPSGPSVYCRTTGVCLRVCVCVRVRARVFFFLLCVCACVSIVIKEAFQCMRWSV